MILKIIVSSQATRQMLEGNIHELRNMFSPNQVVIEERETDVSSLEEQKEEEVMEDEEASHSHESNKDESNDSQGDFEAQFQEILMNEKV